MEHATQTVATKAVTPTVIQQEYGRAVVDSQCDWRTAKVDTKCHIATYSNIQCAAVALCVEGCRLTVCCDICTERGAFAVFVNDVEVYVEESAGYCGIVLNINLASYGIGFVDIREGRREGTRGCRQMFCLRDLSGQAQPAQGGEGILDRLSCRR